MLRPTVGLACRGPMKSVTPMLRLVPPISGLAGRGTAKTTVSWVVLQMTTASLFLSRPWDGVGKSACLHPQAL